MGLDCSHDAWHGAYSAFSRWREKIAEVAGVPPLCFMEGFFEPGNPISDPLWFLKYEKDTDRLERVKDFYKLLPIKWSALKPDPLYDLLHHSDCDGYLRYGQCKKIAKRLEELLPLLPDEDGGGHIGNWREKTQKFIGGCKAAGAAKQRLMFR